MTVEQFVQRFNSIRESNTGRMFTHSELVHLFETNGMCIGSNHFTAGFKRLFHITKMQDRKNIYFLFKRQSLSIQEAREFLNTYRALCRRYAEHAAINTQVYINILRNRGYRVEPLNGPNLEPRPINIDDRPAAGPIRIIDQLHEAINEINERRNMNQTGGRTHPADVIFGRQ